MVSFTASRRFALEAEGLMDLDTANPELGFEDQTPLSSLDRVCALALGGAAVGPTSSYSSRKVGAPADESVSKLNSFINTVTNLGSVGAASSPAGARKGARFTSLSAASYASRWLQ